MRTASSCRRTELIGLMDDGRKVRWGEGNVQPVDTFAIHGSWIEGGQYVINWRGHAITVYCRSRTDGLVHILFMGGGMVTAMPQPDAEALLLGHVIEDPEQTARFLAVIQKTLDALRRGFDAPDCQRGRLA